MRNFDFKSLVVCHLGYLWICTILHNWGHSIFFLTTQWLSCSHNRMYGKCFGFEHGLRSLKQYLIVGRYLGGFSTGCDVTKTLLMYLYLSLIQIFQKKARYEKMCKRAYLTRFYDEILSCHYYIHMINI